MVELLNSGLLLGAIVCLMIIEAALLLFRHKVSETGVAPVQFLPNLLAGLMLMICVQLAIWDSPWQMILAILSLAGLCHLFEFRLYWRGR